MYFGHTKKGSKSRWFCWHYLFVIRLLKNFFKLSPQRSHCCGYSVRFPLVISETLRKSIFLMESSVTVLLLYGAEMQYSFIHGLFFISIFSEQFVIVVVDSTDRERISVTKEELYRMLAHEVSIMKNCLVRHFFAFIHLNVHDLFH